MQSDQGLTGEERAALLAGSGDPGRPANGRRRRRRWPLVVGVLALITASGLALAPTIGSRLVRGMALNAEGPVRATLEQASFGWLSTQRVTVGLRGADQSPAGTLEIEVDRGLLSLARAWTNLGTISVRGDVTVSEALLQAPATPSSPPPPPSAAKRFSLPQGLQATLDLSLSKVRVLDARQQAVAELTDVKTTAEIKTGSPIRIDASATSAGSPLTLKATIENWTDASGNLRTDPTTFTAGAPKIDAEASVQGLSTALIDALGAMIAGSSPGVRAIVGETLSLRLVARGDATAGESTLDLTSPEVRAAGRFVVRDGALTLGAPATVDLSPASVQSLAQRGLTPGGPRLDTAPQVNVSLTSLRIPVPKNGALDLRGATVQLATTAKGTRVTVLPGAAGETTIDIPGIELGVESTDLAGTTTVTARSASTITSRGQTESGGTLDLRVNVGGLLDSRGAPVSGVPGAIDGTLQARGIATALLSAFLPRGADGSTPPIDPVEDLGPSIDLDVAARTQGQTILTTAKVQSRGLNAEASASITPELVQLGETPLRLEAAAAGPIAARLLAKSDRLSLTGPGIVALTMDRLTLPLDKATRTPKLTALEADGVVTLSGWAATIAALQEDGQPLQAGVQELRTNIALRPAQGLTLRSEGDVGLNQVPSRLRIEATLPRIYEALGATPVAGATGLAKTLGAFDADASLEWSGLSPSAASVLGRVAGAPASELAGEALGGPATLTATLARARDREPARAIVKVEAPRTNLTAQADVKQGEAVVQIGAAGSISPALLALVATSPESPGTAPRLRGTANYEFSAEPLTVALTDAMSPDWNRSGLLKTRLSLPGQTVIDRAGQTLGVENLVLSASLPLSVLGERGAGGEAQALLESGLLAADTSRLGSMKGTIVAPLGAGMTLTRPATIDLSLIDFATANLDVAIGQAGLVSGALGPTAQITARTVIDPRAQGPDARTIAQVVQQGAIDAEVTLLSPRLRVEKPLRLALRPDRASIQAQEPLLWTIEPAWFDRFVLGKGQNGPGSELSMAAPARAQVVIRSATVSRPGDSGARGPLLPGVFALDAVATLESLELVDARSVRTRMGSTQIALRSQPPRPGEGPGLGFDMKLERLSVAPDPASAGPGGGQIRGTVSAISTPDGTLNTANPVIDAEGDLVALPTALIDAFSLRNGLPNDILGASVNVRLKTERFSRQGGTLSLTAASTERGESVEDGVRAQRPRAELAINGRVSGGVLETPVTVALRRLDVGLQRRVSDILPMIAQIEKRFEDKPAQLRSAKFAIPLDGDMRKLNGALTVDPGEARFALSGPYGALLRQVNARQEGKMLERLQPLNITATNGLVRYDRWTFPVGEFSIDAEGQVDLPSRTMDIVTWLPLGQVVDEVAQVFRAIPGVANAGDSFNKATMLPFRARGPMGEARPRPDVELFAKNFLRSISPENVVDILRDAIRRPERR